MCSWKVNSSLKSPLKVKQEFLKKKKKIIKIIVSVFSNNFLIGEGH